MAKKRARTRTEYPSQDKIDRDIENHLATLPAEGTTTLRHVVTAAMATKPKPTATQVAAEFDRIARETAPLPAKPRRTMAVDRVATAQFAARQLVEGRSVILTDDSVLAMAELIYYRMTTVGGK